MGRNQEDDEGVFTRRGITLTELMITIAIVAVLAAMVVPNFGKWIQHYRLRGTVREVVSQMELAKIRALKNNLEYRIAFDKDKGTFWLERGNRPDVSGGWTLEGGVSQVPHRVPFDVDVSSMQFNPDGTASSGTVTIGQQGAEHYYITVTTTTGKINVKTEKEE